MDTRAAKLALARKKLKDHQDKKSVVSQKDEGSYVSTPDIEQEVTIQYDYIISTNIENEADEMQVAMAAPKEHEYNPDSQFTEENMNVTEILISNKRNLENQINDLQLKLSQLENNQTILINDNNNYKQLISTLQNQLKNVNEKYLMVCEEILIHKQTIVELNVLKSSFSEENNNLQEQLEFTKAILTSKENEIASLHNQLGNLQNQFDATQLQLQQLTNGLNSNLIHNQISKDNTQNVEVLLQKLSAMEQNVKTLQKEKEQMNMHYEHYASDLNEQLKSVIQKNQELTNQIHALSNRESSLIDQISDMEIRLQNYHKNNRHVQEQCTNMINHKEMQEEYEKVQAKLLALTNSYKDIQKKYIESENKVAELSEVKDSQLNNDSILSITKLNADITSDKVAVQRATEQNKKLKVDLQELEEAFVKISGDKLELTEKLDAEKFLNRELTIKLAEIDEKAKDMYTKLIAKDDEMIRLQTGYRDIRAQLEKVSQESPVEKELEIYNNDSNPERNDPENESEINILIQSENSSNLETTKEPSNWKIPKEDAMLKLQERFLKIMGEVADLSDEKYRLEHIIFQLQNETDTICEYVALYQEQRSLLKKRDEERSAQIKIFKSECELLKRQLEELSVILTRLTADNELAIYLQVEPRREDIVKVMDLLSSLKNNCLIDPERKCSQMKDFYPCNCCSGNLIDV